MFFGGATRMVDIKPEPGGVEPSARGPGRIIITVLGVDRVGIIAGVTGVLAEERANILDIRETIMGDYLTMILIADLESCLVSFDELLTRLEARGRELEVQVNMQHEDVFRYMHRV